MRFYLKKYNYSSLVVSDALGILYQNEALSQRLEQKYFITLLITLEKVAQCYFEGTYFRYGFMTKYVKKHTVHYSGFFYFIY